MLLKAHAACGLLSMWNGGALWLIHMQSNGFKA